MGEHETRDLSTGRRVALSIGWVCVTESTGLFHGGG